MHLWEIVPPIPDLPEPIKRIVSRDVGPLRIEKLGSDVR